MKQLHIPLTPANLPPASPQPWSFNYNSLHRRASNSRLELQTKKSSLWPTCLEQRLEDEGIYPCQACWEGFFYLEQRRSYFSCAHVLDTTQKARINSLARVSTKASVLIANNQLFLLLTANTGVIAVPKKHLKTLEEEMETRWLNMSWYLRRPPRLQPIFLTPQLKVFWGGSGYLFHRTGKALNFLIRVKPAKCQIPSPKRKIPWSTTQQRMKQSISSHISHQFSAQVPQSTSFGIKSYCTELQSRASHGQTSNPPEERSSGVTPFRAGRCTAGYMSQLLRKQGNLA